MYGVTRERPAWTGCVSTALVGPPEGPLETEIRTTPRLDGSYIPQPVKTRGVYRRRSGGTRLLGVPTVVVPLQSSTAVDAGAYMDRRGIERFSEASYGVQAWPLGASGGAVARRSTSARGIAIVVDLDLAI